MIAGIFHSGSGLGNQLHRYVATRVLALDKGFDFSMVAPGNFKGNSFMNLDMGESLDWPYRTELPSGKVSLVSSPISLWEEKTIYYNPEFNFIEDNTIIDGDFQDQRYFEHRMKEVDQWLKVEPVMFNDHTCLICFRGGEYTVFPDLFLTRGYWEESISLIKKENPEMKFIVVTDDYPTARSFFPDYPIMDDLNGKHDMGFDWRSARYAPYLILSNASFYILPALLNQNAKKVIAPRYWARRNIKEWSMPQNYYKKFNYI